MVTAQSTYDRLVSDLGYQGSSGLVEVHDDLRPDGRGEFLRRLRRVLRGIDSVYFCEDVPLAYLARRERFDPRDAVDLHRRVWNDARVPLLFVVSADEVRVYDAQARPTTDPAGADEHERLIHKLGATASFLERLCRFRRESLDTGRYADGDKEHFQRASRCDATLLANLREARDRLLSEGVPGAVVHPLLLRSMLLLHLEHRGVIPVDYYAEFAREARNVTDLLGSRSAAYAFFDAIAERFNGDLLPVSSAERKAVRAEHLALLRDFLCGRIELKHGQHELWPLYDFNIIPIQLVSALYRELLHEGRVDAARDAGAFYTRLPLVELVMNEVLPWPARGEPTPPKLPRVLDPTCGSGVFLVEAFRRLCAYARQKSANGRLSHSQLSGLLSAQVFGVDTNEAAVKVAAFSLYLALLDELDDDGLWQKLRFPTLTASTDGRRANLERNDAFVALKDEPDGFDVIVGNPPWKRVRLPETAAEFCSSRGLPVAHELAHPFMWLATELLRNGRAALVCPSKWLTSHESKDREFRRSFLAKTEVESVVNLTALRRELFDQAHGPASIVVFRQRRAEPSPTVLYCVPKPRSANVPLGLLIDAGDAQWVPRRDAELRDEVWKVLQVATRRDLAFIERLRGDTETLADYIDARRKSGWVAQRGFQPNGDKRLPAVARIPFIEAEWLGGLAYEVPLGAAPTQHRTFKWTGPPEIYRGPHVLLRKGFSPSRIPASYVEADCSFRDAVTSIHAPSEARLELKALAAWMGSSLGRYLFFLSCSQLGSDWLYLNKNEQLGLPSTPLHSKETVRTLAGLVDAWRERPRSHAEILARIDHIIYALFDVTSQEQALIESVLETYSSVGASESAPLKSPHDPVVTYASAFLDVFKEADIGGAWPKAAVVYRGDAPLRVVTFILRRSFQHKRSDTVSLVDGLGSVLKRLDRSLIERESANIYRRRHLRIFERGAMHMVKPNEQRFWTRASALADAETLLADAVAAGGAIGTP